MTPKTRDRVLRSVAWAAVTTNLISATVYARHHSTETFTVVAGTTMALATLNLLRNKEVNEKVWKGLSRDDRQTIDDFIEDVSVERPSEKHRKLFLDFVFVASNVAYLATIAAADVAINYLANPNSPISHLVGHVLRK